MSKTLFYEIAASANGNRIPSLCKTLEITPSTESEQHLLGVGTDGFLKEVVQATLGYTPVNKAGDTMTGGLTLSAGNLNVGAGAIQTAGVTRISSGGAGTLTALDTTGLANLAQVIVQDLPTGRVVSTTTGGRLTTDAGLTRTQTGGVTTTLDIGDGVAAAPAYVELNAPTGYAAMVRMFIGGVLRLRIGSTSNKVIVGTYDASGVAIDDPVSIASAAGGAIELGGSGAVKRDVVLTKLAGTGVRMGTVAADGTLGAVADAAAARTLIEVQKRRTLLSEAGYLDVPYSGSGYLLLNTNTPIAIPANSIANGSVIKMSAFINANIPDYADLIIGIGNNTDADFPDFFSGVKIGDTSSGILNSFTIGSLLINAEISFGDIVSGTNRRLNVVYSVCVDESSPITILKRNYNVDINQALYPHMALDLFGSGSITRYSCAYELIN